MEESAKSIDPNEIGRSHLSFFFFIKLSTKHFVEISKISRIAPRVDWSIPSRDMRKILLDLLSSFSLRTDLRTLIIRAFSLSGL